MMLIRRLLFLLTMMYLSPAYAVLTIDITQGMDDASPIAVVPFAWQGQGLPPENIATIIASDLRRSGRFVPMASQDMPSRPREGSEINYQDWRTLKMDNIVVGKVIQEPEGKFRIQFQLFDVYKASQLTGYSISTNLRDFRQTAHQISDIVYEALTGVRGAFDTHIAYITVEEQNKKRIYQLAIADSDGHDEQVILRSAAPILSPSWSPDGRRLAYVSYSRGRPEIYVQYIQNRRTQRVASHPGSNSAPAWSPDGRYLAMTLSKDGNAEIYLMDVARNSYTRITQNYAIDTEPSWLPDGKGLVFTSDRGGNPQLYEVAIDNGRKVGYPRRLTFEGKYNARATVSPNGKYLAFVTLVEGQFRIATLERETGNLNILTNSRLDESPSFAPNGSMIIYATESNQRGVLSAISVEGRAHQRLSVQQGDVREPAWSPFKTGTNKQ